MRKHLRDDVVDLLNSGFYLEIGVGWRNTEFENEAIYLVYHKGDCDVLGQGVSDDCLSI